MNDLARYASRSASVEMSTHFTGHFVGDRSVVVSSDCLFAGTKRMCPVGIRMRVIMFLCPLIEDEFYGVSSYTKRIKTTKKGVSLCSDDASACGTALNMSSSSYSGMAMRELVHRKRKEFRIAPKTASSGNAEQ